MAISGKPISEVLTKDEITDAIFQGQGNIMRISSILKINPDTFYELLKRNPDLWEVINELRKQNRNYNKKMRVDLAMTNIDRILFSKDAKNADKIKAAQYYLDALGEEEGFGRIEKALNVDEDEMNKYKHLIDQISDMQSERKIDKRTHSVAEKSA